MSIMDTNIRWSFWDILYHPYAAMVEFFFQTYIALITVFQFLDDERGTQIKLFNMPMPSHS
jgi:hypothetical protein